MASTHVAADHLPSSHTPSVTAAWQVVEGEQLEDREGEGCGVISGVVRMCVNIVMVAVLQGSIQLDQNPSEVRIDVLSF